MTPNSINPYSQQIPPAQFGYYPFQSMPMRQAGLPYSPVRQSTTIAPIWSRPTQASSQSLPNETVAQAPVAIYSSAYAMPWQNQLKELFHNREAVIYALNLRTFGADDRNGNNKIDPELGESGTFSSAIKRLPYLKSMGINTIHMLPINPVGQIGRLGLPGAPGSVYSPSTLESLNPEFDDVNDPRSVIEEAKAFVQACHKYGINVMADIPSCGAIDLEKAHPGLFARDENGNSLTPTTWVDIRMFKKDSPELRDYYGKLFKLLAEDVGVDGFRVDVARARTPQFWRYFIDKYPTKAWLAESYTEEDASPMKNIPRDIPGQLLQAGFDSVYGQFHIFDSMSGDRYKNYLLENKGLIRTLGKEKSFIGSFGTHDDKSLMTHGGPIYCNLVTGLMLTQPDTNPYMIDGYLTGHNEEFDIFNWEKPFVGHHSEIGQYFKEVMKIRNQYKDVITKGNFVPLSTSNPNIIAYVRQYNGRSLMVLANKNVNSAEKALIQVPTLKVDQKLENLAPDYGDKSTLIVDNGQMYAYPLAPGKLYMFDADLKPQAGY